MVSTIENRKSIPNNPDRLNRFGPWVLTALAAGLALSRVWLVFNRLYDPDELEHLHAGFCVWRGMVPYRDFFEQHGPVLWYLSLPLFAIWGESLDVLFAGRFVIWLISFATYALVWRLGNRLYGRWGGAVASLLLALLPAFQEKNMEWRPDNVAVPLVLLAVSSLGRTQGTRPWRYAMLAGMAISAAFFCTQKVAYVGVGVVVAFTCTSLVDERLRACRELLAIGVGAVVFAGSVALCFAAQGALGPFVRMTILLPLEWKTHEPVERYLFMTLFSAPVFWGAFAAALVIALSDVRQFDARRAGVGVVAGGAAAHVLGLLFVPAAFYQYYLPLAPLAALLGCRAVLGLAGLLADGAVRDRTGRGVRFAASFAGVTVAAIALCFRLFPDALHPQVRGFVSAMPASMLWAQLGCLSIFALAVFLLARPLAAFTLLTAVGLAAAPYLWIQFRWSHKQETELIQRLMRATTPDDQFFDSFTGWGALRPHAFFYFWINRHSWPLIPDDEKRSGVLEALSDDRTRVVLYDEYFHENLPPVVQDYLRSSFEPDVRYSWPRCVVFVRKGRELP